MEPVEFDARERLMAVLSFCAYCDFVLLNPRKIYKDLKKLLHTAAPEQEIIWGPAIHKREIEIITESLMFMVKDLGRPSEYTVVVRGTNPLSFLSWIIQDFDVVTLLPWAGDGDERRISRGTYKSLVIHRDETIPARKVPGAGTKIFDFIQDIVQKSRERVTFNFTGHSLGGLMSPTLALWIKEHLPEELAEKIDFHIFPFAGPTAGNRAFAEYADRSLTSCRQYGNPLDIAVHAWNVESLKELQETYREYFQESSLLRKLLESVCERVKDKGYTQMRDKKQVPAEMMTGIKNPMVQAAFQHVFPYLKIFCEPSQGEKIFSGLWKKLKPLLDNASLEKGEKLLLKNMIEAGFDLGLKGGSKISA